MTSKNQAWADYAGQWALEKGATLLPLTAMAPLTDLLNDLPWKGNRLDWTVLRGIPRNAAHGPVDVTGSRFEFLREIIAYCGPEQPGVIGPRDMILNNLDELFWLAPGTRYIVGITREHLGALQFVAEAVGEYDGGDWVTLSIA